MYVYMYVCVYVLHDLSSDVAIFGKRHPLRAAAPHCFHLPSLSLLSLTAFPSHTSSPDASFSPFFYLSFDSSQYPSALL